MRFFGLVFLLASFAWAQQDYNDRGIDPRVDYNQMFEQTREDGIPWDDRNLNLTKEDLGILPADDRDDRAKIPVFFRVYLRQSMTLRTKGPGQYPLAAHEVYELFHGGQYLDGLFVEHERTELGGSVTINGEVEVTTGRRSAESAIAINPVDPNIVIVGVNGPTGQEMYYSQDAGLSWTRSLTNLSPSCCDPAVDWSPDGQIGYMAQMGTCSGLCNIEIFVSNDFGVTWVNRVTVDGGGVHDKEFIHVDHRPDSPHFGNLYITYHTSNVLKFSRSTDQGASFSPPIAFTGTGGIGADIATDSNGMIFHVWSSFSTNSIRMNLSNDGGQTFGPISEVATVNATFNFFIPSFANRGAPIIVSADADNTDGPFQDRLYAVWADTTAAPQGNPANNHARIRFVYSADGGTTWNLVTPHEVDDLDTVDRYNPWMEVDEDGNVHLVFYSTQDDPTRLGNDLYHTISANGGQSWSTPQRVTTATSPQINDNFQWGDYNGMSIVDGKIRPVFTGNLSSQRTVYTADIEGMAPDFLVGQPSENLAVCAGESVGPIDLPVESLNGFSGSVSFDLAGLPTGFSGSFSNNPLTPPGSAQVTLSTTGAATEGSKTIEIIATSGAISHSLNLDVFVRTLPVATVGSWWLDPGQFEAGYDENGNNVIDVVDLIDRVNCLNIP